MEFPSNLKQQTSKQQLFSAFSALLRALCVWSSSSLDRVQQQITHHAHGHERRAREEDRDGQHRREPRGLFLHDALELPVASVDAVAHLPEHLGARRRGVADGLHRVADVVEVLGDGLVGLAELLDAVVQRVELHALLGAALADLLEDLGELLLLRVLVSELLADRPQRLALHATGLGQRFERLRQVREVVEQLVLATPLAVQVVADRAHQVGQRMEAFLKVLDRSVAPGPRAQEAAARLDGGRATVQVLVVLAQREVAVRAPPGAAALEPRADPGEEGRLFVHESILAAQALTDNSGRGFFRAPRRSPPRTRRVGSRAAFARVFRRSFDSDLGQIYHPRPMFQQRAARFARFFFVGAALCANLIGCERPSAPAATVAATTRTAEADRTTVVSLVPAATDLILGMGAGEHLLAVSNW